MFNIFWFYTLKKENFVLTLRAFICKI